ncbi:hypothetical protein K435DRAFT_810333 [Dendrothele bispora CBS 962.96]|uniref:Uncharacterized protein n=1 Tax=Dendrothele bispora (strain CBS 962.96) TaxID=1314807 RepID=A0A4V4HBL6_DENBC|nr:hypothetical protein K435DRAFT_810333 [Dendrothele bispora CBS 962.96]
MILQSPLAYWLFKEKQSIHPHKNVFYQWYLSLALGTYSLVLLVPGYFLIIGYHVRKRRTARDGSLFTMPHPVAPIAASGTSISSSCSCRAIVKAKPLGSLPANFVGIIPTWTKSSRLIIDLTLLQERLVVEEYLLKVDHEHPVQPCPQVTPP